VAELKLARALKWFFGAIEWRMGNVRLHCEDWCHAAEKRQEARRG